MFCIIVFSNLDMELSKLNNQQDILVCNEDTALYKLIYIL